jgi:predicted RND superfamily exporter protein
MHDNDELPQYSAPSIAEAKTFRGYALPRRLRDPNQPSGYRLARPGELVNAQGEPSMPYSLLKSKSNAIDEFGIGISLYFKTVKVLFALFVILALICLIPMYENKKSNPTTEDVDFLQTLGINVDATPVQLIGSVYGATRDSLKYNKQGAADIVCVLIVLIFLFVAPWLERRAVERIDVAQQTTQDYSVCVMNPPETVTDTKAYHKHFSRFGEVVLVTIVKNNGALLKELALKKVLTAKLQNAEFVTANLGDEFGDGFKAWVMRKLYDTEQVDSLKKKLAVNQQRIDALAQRDYRPWRVFITFNSEHSQRSCLNRASTSFVARRTGLGISDDAKFEDHILHVKEAMEPSEVIYENSHVSLTRRVASIVLSFSLSACLVVAAFYIIKVSVMIYCLWYRYLMHF